MWIYPCHSYFLLLCLKFTQELRKSGKLALAWWQDNFTALLCAAKMCHFEKNTNFIEWTKNIWILVFFLFFGDWKIFKIRALLLTHNRKLPPQCCTFWEKICEETIAQGGRTNHLKAIAPRTFPYCIYHSTRILKCDSFWHKYIYWSDC